MIKYLLLFSIGPVQGFIAQARKTQDFYAGSYLLSHLSRTALLKARELGGSIVFPNPALSGLPNRFLVEFTLGDREGVKGVGRQLETTVRGEFTHLSEAVVEEMGFKITPEFTQQIENTLEVYWVAAPIGEEGYAAAYRRLGFMLGSVKRTRRFQQFVQEPGRRCLLTGEHNVLFIRPRSGSKRVYAPQAQIAGEGVSLKYLAEGEGLGATAFVKRCADRCFKGDFTSDFESTAKIALLDSYEKLKEADPDFAPLLEEDFADSLIFDLHNKRVPVSFTGEMRLPSQIYCGLRENGIPINPYYGFMSFDGDGIGKLYSEPVLQEGKTLREFHSFFSDAMAKYGEKVEKEIMQLPVGRAVYAGGEDFVGFLSLEHLLTAAKRLRMEFGQIDLSEFTPAKLTFSAGLVVAHYKNPLSEVFNWAGKMEAQAKNIDAHKDALGIAVIKGSGETHTALLKWKTKKQWNSDTLQRLIMLLGEGQYSSNFIQSFASQFSRLANLGADAQIGSLDQMVSTELRRLIHRAKQGSKDVGDLREGDVQALPQELYRLYLDSGTLANFIKVLEIAAFLAKNRGDDYVENYSL